MDPDDVDTEVKVERALQVLSALLRQGAPVCVAWSAGKDSSAVLNLLLVAASRIKAAGDAVPSIVVTHADTMIENPEMTLYARSEMVQVRSFAKRHRLDVSIEVASPNLTNQWAVRVIGGRALPPFPGTHRDCTLDWKIQPMKKLRKSVLKHLAKRTGAIDIEPVVLLGTRYGESTTRAANMRERGESDVQVRRGIDEKGKASHLFLSPICWWTTDDVWMYLGLVRGGKLEGYSDFEDTFRMYADASNTTCVIVAEDMAKAMKSSKACGARHGCSLCTVTATDQSMENMLANDERYAYMRGLNELRNFLSATRWDMARRSWLGRTIKNGYVRVGPDAYSPAMMEDLLKYALTIDIREREAAMARGHAPRFQLVGIEQLISIDAMWSLQAFHKPFHAIKIFDEVEKGARWEVPHLVASPRQPEMPERYLWVGQDWEDGDRMRYTGLNSAMHELASFDGGSCMGTKELADGRTVLDVNAADMMAVDAESAFFLLDERDRLLARHDAPGACPTEAYFHYLQMGTLTIKNGLQGEVDSILRRSHYKVRQGIDGAVDWRTLWAKAIPAREAGMKNDAPKQRQRGADGSLSVSHQDLLSTVADEVEFDLQPERMRA